jgi:hypothetical protein
MNQIWVSIQFRLVVGSLARDILLLMVRIRIHVRALTTWEVWLFQHQSELVHYVVKKEEKIIHVQAHMNQIRILIQLKLMVRFMARDIVLFMVWIRTLLEWLHVHHFDSPNQELPLNSSPIITPWESPDLRRYTRAREALHFNSSPIAIRLESPDDEGKIAKRNSGWGRWRERHAIQAYYLRLENPIPDAFHGRHRRIESLWTYGHQLFSWPWLWIRTGLTIKAWHEEPTATFMVRDAIVSSANHSRQYDLSIIQVYYQGGPAELISTAQVISRLLFQCTWSRLALNGRGQRVIRLVIPLVNPGQGLRARFNPAIPNAESTLMIAHNIFLMNQDFQRVIFSGEGPVRIFGNDLGMILCIIYSSRSRFLFASIRPSILQILQFLSTRNRSSHRLDGSLQRIARFFFREHNFIDSNQRSDCVGGPPSILRKNRLPRICETILATTSFWWTKFAKWQNHNSSFSICSHSIEKLFNSLDYNLNERPVNSVVPWRS